MSAAMFSALKSHYACLELLVEAGARLDFKDLTQKKQALDWASERKCVALLVRATAEQKAEQEKAAAQIAAQKAAAKKAEAKKKPVPVAKKATSFFSKKAKAPEPDLGTCVC